MTESVQAVVGNLLIEQLPDHQKSQLLSVSQQVDLQFGDSLYIPGELYAHVYFPLIGFISLVAELNSHPSLEVGMIGNEGMLGATLSLGVATAPLHAVVQGSGSALRVSVQDFHCVMNGAGNLRTVMGRYVYVLMKQLSRTAACTHYHNVERRLARWLLMTHDRAHADQFYLTHKFLADMLGVQRSAVTIAAGIMQERRLIQYTRGVITVLDRGRLEKLSCDCYAALRGDYAHEFTAPDRPH